jgi:hypothetical protein
LKKASMECETSALSIPVFSAICVITSALVTLVAIKYSRIQDGKFNPERSITK